MLWQVGWYVTLHVADVPVSVVEYFRQGAPLIAFSLLPYEQKVNQCFVRNEELYIFFQHFVLLWKATFLILGVRMEKSMMVIPKMSEPV